MRAKIITEFFPFTELFPEFHSATLRLESLQLQVVRKVGVRRLILRVKSKEIIRLTMPLSTALTRALAFVRKHLAWVRAQLERFSTAIPVPDWGDGKEIFFRGEIVTVRLSEPSPGTFEIRFGDQTIPWDKTRAIKEQIQLYLHNLARRELPHRVLELAAKERLEVRAIRIGNQKTRWGSCSGRGVISLNWRLLLVPDWVQDSVIYHELMHLVELNHSARFWDLLESIYPDYEEAQLWLKAFSRCSTNYV